MYANASPLRYWCHVLGRVLAVGLIGAAAAQSTAQQSLSLDEATRLNVPLPHSAPTHLEAWWWSAQTEQAADESPRPAIVLLHGCAGLLDRYGMPRSRMQQYARLLRAQGWHVLALDSFTTRGVHEICTRHRGQAAAVTQQMRKQDVWAALQWLTQVKGVDATRLAIIGWSNGGSTVLEATHRASLPTHSASGLTGLKFAIAFYPGCAFRARTAYQPLVDVLLLVGLADDWTPAQDCLALASPRVAVHAWADAHHGFDSLTPVQFRADVRGGVNPQGVHVGANPQARQESQALMLASLRHAFAD